MSSSSRPCSLEKVCIPCITMPPLTLLQLVLVTDLLLYFPICWIQRRRLRRIGLLLGPICRQSANRSLRRSVNKFRSMTCLVWSSLKALVTTRRARWLAEPTQESERQSLSEPIRDLTIISQWPTTDHQRHPTCMETWKCKHYTCTRDASSVHQNFHPRMLPGHPHPNPGDAATPTPAHPEPGLSQLSNQAQHA